LTSAGENGLEQDRPWDRSNVRRSIWKPRATKKSIIKAYLLLDPNIYIRIWHILTKTKRLVTKRSKQGFFKFINRLFYLLNDGNCNCIRSKDSEKQMIRNGVCHSVDNRTSILVKFVCIVIRRLRIYRSVEMITPSIVILFWLLLFHVFWKKIRIAVSLVDIKLCKYCSNELRFISNRSKLYVEN